MVMTCKLISCKVTFRIRYGGYTNLCMQISILFVELGIFCVSVLDN